METFHPFGLFRVTNKAKRRIAVIARDAQQAAALAVELHHVKQPGNAKVTEEQSSSFSTACGIEELRTQRVAGLLTALVKCGRVRARLVVPGEKEPRYAEWEPDDKA